MASIGDSQRSVGGQNLGFYQKHRSHQARVGQGYPLHIKMAQALQSPEHIYYGRYLASEPPSGLRQVNTTGFGLFNGGGFLPPPPRPGARLVTGEVGQSLAVRLGEVYQHGGNDEIGEGALQLGTDIPVVSSPWMAPAAASMDGLTFISYIPKPDDEGTHLNLEMPGNQMFFANQTATNYHISVGTDVVAENQTVSQNVGSFSTTTNRLMGEVALRQAVTDYNHIYSGTAGINLLDGSTQVNEIQAAPVDTGFSNVLEQLIDLPIINEKFREVVYCLMQNLASDAWSGTGDNPVAGLVQNLTQEAGLGEAAGVMAQLNKWLPEALKIKDLLFGQSQQQATVGTTTIDLQTLDLTLDVSQGLEKLNTALDEPAFVFSGSSLTVCNFEITNNTTYEQLPLALVECLQDLNSRLPTDLKFKTFGTNRVTALRITPGLFISEGKALVIETKIGNPVTIAFDALRCTLPVQLDQLAELEYSDQGIQSKPFSVEKLLSTIQLVVGAVESPEAALSILTGYLPAELKDVFRLEGNSVFVNPDSIYNFGVTQINQILPSQLQLGINSEDGKISGVTLGPLSASIGEEGLTLGLDLAKTVGGLNIKGIVDFLPEGFIQDFLSSTTFEVQLPYDHLESEAGEETINQGGYLGEWPELNLSDVRQGSPIPLLLSTLECLSAFGEDASATPSIPGAESYQLTAADISCHQSSTNENGYANPEQVPVLNKEPFNIADITEWPQQLVDEITTAPLSPPLPVFVYEPSDSPNPLEAMLNNFGLPGGSLLNNLRGLSNNQSLVSLMRAISDVGPTPLKLATINHLQNLRTNPRDLVEAVNGCDPQIAEDVFDMTPTEASQFLLYTPLDIDKVTENPIEFVNWISANEPSLQAVTENLMFGEMPEFFTQLIYLRTGQWLPAHPKTYNKLMRLVEQEFGYAA